MWIQSAKEVPLGTIATAVGLNPGRGRSLSPCPHCGAETRGSNDRRGPVGVARDDRGWKCHACGACGDGVDLVAMKLEGDRLRNLTAEKKRTVREWYLQRGWIAQHTNGTPVAQPKRREPRERQRPKQEEVLALWAASRKIETLTDSGVDAAVLRFLERRQFDIPSLIKSGVARVLPHPDQHYWPQWWPKRWSSQWKIIVPAFEIDGTFASIHARSVFDRDDAPKTRWPMGVEAGGLFMANREGMMLMKGSPAKDLHGLLICEGITDLLMACSEVTKANTKLAIISGASGSFSSLSSLNVPDNAAIYIGCDPDEQGDEYASTIAKTLAPRKVYRLPLERTLA